MISRTDPMIKEHPRQTGKRRKPRGQEKDRHDTAYSI